MSDLRQIVRERLKAAGPVGNHPDPDVLTAFAEQSLPVRERASVLEHVSRCGECREVLALATPPIHALDPESTLRGSSRNWLHWPALRWGAAAACFVVVGAAVLLERNHKMDRYASLTPAAMKVSDEQQAVEEKGAAISDLAVQKAVTPSPAASAPNARAKDEKADAVIAPPAASADSRKPPMNPGVAGGLATTREQAIAEANERAMSSNLERDRADRKYDQFSQQHSLQVEALPAAPAPARATPVPPPAPANAGAGVAASVGPASSGAVGGVLAKKQVPGRAKASPMLDQDMNAPAPQAVGESKEMVEVTGFPAAVPVNGRNVTPLVPRWTISADGQLQRSRDYGKTWEIVPVLDNSSLSLVSAEVSTNYQQEMRAQQSDKAKARTEPSPERNTPKFRALSANGNDVWVGGTAGLLYHSADAGMHWTRVRAVADGATLTADIVTLDFADAQHGRVVVASGETWVTIDGGKNWKKQ